MEFYHYDDEFDLEKYYEDKIQEVRERYERREQRKKERQEFLKEYYTTTSQVEHFVMYGYPRLKRLFKEIQRDICSNKQNGYKYWTSVYALLVSMVKGEDFLQKFIEESRNDSIDEDDEELSNDSIDMEFINKLKAHPKVKEYLPKYQYYYDIAGNEELIKNLLSRTTGCCALYVTSLDYLKELAQNESVSKDIKLGFLLRSNLPQEIFEILASSNDIEIIKKIAKHRNAPQKLLCEYAKPYQNPEVIKLAISNPSLPVEIVEEYAYKNVDGKFKEIQKIAKKALIARFSIKNCIKLSDDEDKEIKDDASKQIDSWGPFLASNHNTESSTISELLEINSYDIDKYLINNPNTTEEQINVLFDRFQNNAYNLSEFWQDTALKNIFQHKNAQAHIKEQLRKTKYEFLGYAVLKDSETTKEDIIWLALNGSVFLSGYILDREDIITFPTNAILRLVRCAKESEVVEFAKRSDLPMEVAYELLGSERPAIVAAVLKKYNFPYEKVSELLKSKNSTIILSVITNCDLPEKVVEEYINHEDEDVRRKARSRAYAKMMEKEREKTLVYKANNSHIVHLAE